MRRSSAECGPWCHARCSHARSGPVLLLGRQRTDEGGRNLVARCHVFAVELDVVAEQRLRLAEPDLELVEFPLGEDAGLEQLLGLPDRGAEPHIADDPLDRLLDGPLTLVEVLPLAGRLVAGDVTRGLQGEQRLLDLGAERRDVGADVAHEQLRDHLGHAGNPRDPLEQPQHLQHARGLDGVPGTRSALSRIAETPDAPRYSWE